LISDTWLHGCGIVRTAQYTHGIAYGQTGDSVFKYW